MRDLIDRFEQTAISVLLAAMTIVTFSQVVARYVFNTGAVWALELTVFLFAWLVLFGMSYGVKAGFHIGVDAFARMLPERTFRVLALVVGFLGMAYAVILLIGAWEYWWKIYRIGIEAQDLPIPRWVPYLILPIGLLLLLYRLGEACVDIVQGRRHGIAASHEVEDSVAEARDQLDDGQLDGGQPDGGQPDGGRPDGGRPDDRK